MVSTPNKRKYWREVKRRSRARNRKFIIEHLSDHPCVDCGETDPVVLEFDHVRGKKLDTISNLAFRYTSSLKKLTEEIRKCEVRCANCHRRRHAKERNKQTNGVMTTRVAPNH